MLATLEHSQLSNGRDREPCRAHRHLALQVPALCPPVCQLALDNLHDEDCLGAGLCGDSIKQNKECARPRLRSDVAGQGTQLAVTGSPVVDTNTLCIATARNCMQRDTVC